jgi:hypothetical protein
MFLSLLMEFYVFILFKIIPKFKILQQFLLFLLMTRGVLQTRLTHLQCLEKKHVILLLC